MTSAAELQVRFTATGAQQVQGEIAKTGSAVKGFGGIASTAGKAAAAGLLGMGAAAAVGLGMATKVALGYEAQMANVNSILQLSDAGIAAYSDQLLQLASNPGITQSPTQLAEGLYNVVSSGFAGADAMTVLEVSAIAATAGLTSTETSGRAVTSVLNAYGLEASEAGHVSDILFQTVQDGVLTFDELANNMGSVLPMAASLGVSLEDVGAAYSQLTLQGQSATQAETGIANLMKSALNPTDALTSAVQAQGFATADAAIETLGLGGYVQLLEKDAAATGKTLFDYLGTQEGVNAALAIGGDNIADYVKEQEKMKTASDGIGATQKALEKQMKSGAFAIAKAKQSLQILAVTIGGMVTPAITKAAYALTGFIMKGLIPFAKVIGAAFKGGNEFRKLVEQFPEPLQRAIGAFGSIAESIGDVARAFGDRGLMGAINTLFQGGELQQIGTALSAIADEAFSAITAAFNAIPWGTLWDIAVTGITAAAGGVIDLVKVSVTAGIELLGDIGDAAGDLWGWVLNKLYGGGGPVDPGGTGGPEPSGADQNIPFGTVFVDGALELIGQLGEAAGDLWGWVQNKLFGGSGPVDPAGTGGPAGGGGNTLTMDATIDGVVDLLGDLLAIETDFDSWINGKVGPLAADLDATLSINPNADFNVKANDLGKRLGAEAGRQMVAGLKAGFLSIFGGGGGGGSDLGNVGASDVLGLIPQIKTAIDSFMSGVMAGIGTAIGTAFADGFKAVAPIIDQAGANFMANISGALAGAFDGGSSGATGLFNDAGDQLFGSSGGGIVSGITTWIEGEIDTLKGKVSGWKDSITSAIKDIIPTSITGLKMPGFTIETGAITTAVDAAVKIIDTATGLLDAALARLGLAQRKAADSSHSGGAGTGGGGAGGGGGYGGSATTPGYSGPTQQAEREGTTGEDLLEEKKRFAGSTNLPRQKMPELDTSAYEASVNKLPGLLAKGIASAQVIASSGATQIGAAVGVGLGMMVGNATALMSAFTNAVGQGMSGALSAASTYATAIYSVVSTQIGTMVGNVAALMGANTNNIGAAMSAALGAATTYAAAIASNVIASMSSMVGSVSGIVWQIPGIIAGALSSAAGSAFGYGANIGASLAAGISSQIGAVAAAAAALSAAATVTVAAQLKIASPSKVFFGYGENVSQGFALGIQHRTAMAAHSAQLLAAAVSGQNQRYGSSGGGGGVSSGGGAVVYNTGPRYYGSVNLTPQSPEVHQAISSSAIRRGRP